jgi:hypothetical protein
MPAPNKDGGVPWHQHQDDPRRLRAAPHGHERIDWGAPYFSNLEDADRHCQPEAIATALSAADVEAAA